MLNKVAMIAMTTNNSINVKPVCFDLLAYPSPVAVGNAVQAYGF